jgi:hypothetical protein
MRWDLLLEWMTHVGSGQWGAFRAAVDSLASADDPEPQQLARRLRIALSDRGHAEFFLGGTAQWRVMQPALAGLAAGAEAMLVGGRTRRLADEVTRTAEQWGACVTIIPLEGGPCRIHLAADDRALSSIAAASNIAYIPQAALCLASRCKPLSRSLQEASLSEEPLNWAVRSWSFPDRAWRCENLPNTAREYKNRYGIRRYMVAAGRTQLREMEKRHAIYAAALLNRQSIACYRPQDCALLVPIHAPLPADYARAACLASGTPPAVRDSDLVFAHVPLKVAEILLVALGHRYTLGGGVQ